jgi:nucleoside-diphosphate-sugar epimerase
MQKCSELAGRSLLVLGAGYAGGAFVRQAVAGGLRVTALTRNSHTAEALRHSGCASVVEADLAGTNWHAAVSGEFDFVVNCVSAGGGGIAGYRHSYVEGMESVVRWLSSRTCSGTIVYTSSTGVYPQGGGAEIDETASTDSSGETGSLLAEAERVLTAGAAAAGWRWFVLRLAGIYGPGRHGMLDQIRAGVSAVAGSPTHRMNIIHLDDICSALWACLGASPEIRDNVFNLSDNAPATRAEVADWLATRLGRDHPVFDDTLGTAADGRRRRAPDRNIVADKIQRVLGWRPIHADYKSGYAGLLR